MFKDSDVPRVPYLHWVEEDGYLRVFNSEKAVQVCLGGAEAEIWKLIDQDLYTIEEIIMTMRDQGTPELQVRETITRLHDIQCIYTKNYLWQDDEDRDEDAG